MQLLAFQTVEVVDGEMDASQSTITVTVAPSPPAPSVEQGDEPPVPLPPRAKAEEIGDDKEEDGTLSSEPVVIEKTPSIRAPPSTRSDDDESDDEFQDAHDKAMSVGSFGSPEDNGEEAMKQMIPKAKVTAEHDDFSMPATVSSDREDEGGDSDEGSGSDGEELELQDAEEEDKDGEEVVSAVPTVPTVPAVLTAPAVPSVPAVPTGPAVPTVTTVPAVPIVSAVPIVPAVPTVPAVPDVPVTPVVQAPPTHSHLQEDTEAEVTAKSDVPETIEVKSGEEKMEKKEEVKAEQEQERVDVEDINDADEEWDGEGEEDEDEDEDDDLEEMSEDDVNLAALVAAAEAEAKRNVGAAKIAPPPRGLSNGGLGFAPLGPAPVRNAAGSGTGSAGGEEAERSGNGGDPPSATQVVPREDVSQLDKLMLIRVRLLRIAHRLGQSPNNSVISQVLYRMQLAEQLQGPRTGQQRLGIGGAVMDRADRIAKQLELDHGPDSELKHELRIMLLGKTGVGKTATIHSLLNLPEGTVLEPTNKVREIVGSVHGIKLRLIDVPGLHPSMADLRQNLKILRSAKGFLKGKMPDNVLYVDRLDMQSRDFGDIPLMRSITDVFGPTVWMNSVIVFTHAAAAPPDGPNGQPLSYEMYLAQRSHVAQQTIRQIGGDARLMNPVALVENHPGCRTNRTGDRVLPNGQVWKPQLLLLCCAAKALAESHEALNSKGGPQGMVGRQRPPHLPYLFSSMLSAKQPVRLPEDQMLVDEDDDFEPDDMQDDRDDVNVDTLPPFKRFSKEEVRQLSPADRRTYYEALAEQERLFQKKLYREEMRRRKEARRRLEGMVEGIPGMEEAAMAPPSAIAEEEASASNVAVPAPDIDLPPSFDADYPSHRFRFLEPSGQWMVRPLLETNGWDHDLGYDSFQVEKMFSVGGKVPATVSGTFAKDKKESQLSLEGKTTIRHGREDSSPLTIGSVEVQSAGKDTVVNLQTESVFSTMRRNKAAAGFLLAVMGASGPCSGFKLEDRMVISKQLKATASAGIVRGGGLAAWGGQLEVNLRDKDYPLERSGTAISVSMMKWQGDVALGANVQSQMNVGKTTVVARAQINNRGLGSIGLRAQSHEQLQIALVGLIPLMRYFLSGGFLLGN